MKENTARKLPVVQYVSDPDLLGRPLLWHSPYHYDVEVFKEPPYRDEGPLPWVPNDELEDIPW